MLVHLEFKKKYVEIFICPRYEEIDIVSTLVACNIRS